MSVFKINAPYTPCRDEGILKWCSGKTVLHIGACDAPHTLDKFRSGTLLHKKLANVASNLRGIDIDPAGIDQMAKLGFVIDPIDLNKPLTLNFNPDVIIFGETIEHLTNFDNTFESIAKIMRSDTRLILSTPNAYYLMNFINAIRGIENQHPEHTCVFSLQTIRQLVGRYDMEVSDTRYTFLPRIAYGLGRRLTMMLAPMAPTISETLLVQVRRKTTIASSEATLARGP